MGRLRDLVSRVKGDVAPLASQVREQVSQQVGRLREEVIQPMDKVREEGTPQVKIFAQPSMTDANVCKFTTEVPVHEGRIVRIDRRDAAVDSPLAQRLLEVPGVVAVSFAGNSITVTKEGAEPWQTVARQIGPAIRAHLASGQPAVTREPDPVDDEGNDEALFSRVQEVIDMMINPGVGSHGGFVRLVSVEKDTAYIQMGGGCHGCGMADYTLKQGIAQAIRAQVPEIAHVLDATDHSSGMNPFYARE